MLLDPSFATFLLCIELNQQHPPRYMWDTVKIPSCFNCILQLLIIYMLIAHLKILWSHAQLQKSADNVSWNEISRLLPCHPVTRRGFKYDLECGWHRIKLVMVEANFLRCMCLRTPKRHKTPGPSDKIRWFKHISRQQYISSPMLEHNLA